MARMHLCEDVVPLCALLAIDCINVSASILFRAATIHGMNYYVYIVYSTAVSTLVLLLPLPFILQSSTGLPSFTSSLFFRIFLLRVIGMEKAELRSSKTQAKIMGSAASIAGALLVVIFRGPTLMPASSSWPPTPANSSLDSSSPQTKWVLSGFLLLVQYLTVPIWYIVQTQVTKEYPAKLMVVFLYNLWGTIVAAPPCLIAEPDLSAWKIKPDISLASVFNPAWGPHLKGPLYVTIFKTLSVAIAAAMSVIFLGDALVIGAVILSVGFYAVIWGKAKEAAELKLKEKHGLCSSEEQTNCRTPLWQNCDDAEDNSK
ncbi:WAT1-related protein At5g40230-like [Neltuma alba]|uniref:WAT1-related protein At5g40230-like n=1 Tax=Neltuma alba TaxID=207710 RepID=UPI0010A2F7CB|nr:WAT1-related protein At5g40230-like [Prosopis alba]